MDALTNHRTLTNPYLLAAGFGAIVGVRSMAGPMLLSRGLLRRGASIPHTGVVARLASRPLARGLTAFAISEMAGDKFKRMPDRTRAPLLGMRLASGALAGVAVGRVHNRNTFASAAVGAAAAVAATFASLFVRRRLAQATRLSPGIALGVVGAVEDAAILAGGYGLTRKALGVTPWAMRRRVTISE